ncbi:hypothetical protein JCM17843_15610 [Kordiimonadales bacterium JCM 17843]|nr:hypothetical protein JCM17843_15610 [Kordiimonadales bacterium JCM 17843]
MASYGQIARYVPGVTARMVGYALAGIGDKTGIPWHRVVNAKGTVSPHQGAFEQRQRLEAEGIQFNARDQLDWSQALWPGPDPLLLLGLGLDPEDAFRT